MLLSGDREIATVKGGELVWRDDALLPLYLKRTGDLEGWLSSRAIDRHRPNSRLLKRVLRLTEASDAETALEVNAATVTDRYWFRSAGSALTYEDVRFKSNDFASLSLRGDPDGFSLPPSRTPELTNTGSYEKCWRNIDGVWWLYKNENGAEMFSEMFVSRLGERLGFSVARYDLDGGYIRSRDFTGGAVVNYEPMSGITGDNEDYAVCFDALYALSPVLAAEYLRIIFLDTLVFNMDRHTENFGVLRDPGTGGILAMAPNFDNNIALISRGYPTDRTRRSDALIRFFEEFLKRRPQAAGMLRNMNIPRVTGETVDAVMAEIPLAADRGYIREFILNGQSRVLSAVWRERDTER